jgi:hypothetical protein
MFKLTIKLGNAGMLDREDVAAALERVAETLRTSESDDGTLGIRDINGSTVGRWEFA